MSKVESTLIMEPIHEQYKQRLILMYKQNYAVFRKQELHTALCEYFNYLEREITGDNNTKNLVTGYTVQQLEGMLPELVVLLMDIQSKKAQISSKLST